MGNSIGMDSEAIGAARPTASLEGLEPVAVVDETIIGDQTAVSNSNCVTRGR